MILGVIDGTLAGGAPKAVVLEATASIADLSVYGIGSANNGGGTDDQEFALPANAVSTGQHIIIASGQNSSDFFTSNYPGGDFALFQSGAANVNGDDAIELFFNAAVIDTYGDINVSGAGESWDYIDGWAMRIGGSAGVFDPGNYSFSQGSLAGLTESQQAGLLDGAFGFGTAQVPEPSTTLLGLVALGSLAIRRRRSKQA